MPDPFPRPTRLTAALAVGLLFFTQAVHVRAQTGSTLDVSEYAAQLRQLAAAVEATPAEAAAELPRRVPSVWSVRTPRGTIEVPGAWVQRRLHEAAVSRSGWLRLRGGLAQELRATAREAEAFGEGGSPEAMVARKALDEVLARPEFGQVARESAMARLQARLLEFMRRWWTLVGGDRLAVGSAATVFAWAASLTALAVLGFWMVHALRRASRRRSIGLEPPERRRVPAHIWAARAEAQQDPGETVRYAYRAVVTHGEEEGTWPADASRTPREYVRLLPASYRRRRIVEDAARRFEEIWFGGRPATPEDRGAVLRSLRELGCLGAD